MSGDQGAPPTEARGWLTSPWIKALRLRTLPLAGAVILMPSGVLALQGLVQIPVVLKALGTAFCLQILSNLANDYGDALKGTDRQRIGPARMVASGQISPKAMKAAVWMAVGLALTSGLWLIQPLWALGSTFWIWLAVGLSAVVAAVRYTVGPSPYGYRSLGEVAVLIFFGPVPYLGMLVLHRVPVQAWDWAPALGCGLVAASVLNLNNLRDRHTDALSQKVTLAVRWGEHKARILQTLLVATGLIGFLLYAFAHSVPLMWGWSLMALAYAKLLSRVWTVHEPAAYDAFLKPTALYLLCMSVMPWILYLRLLGNA